ncbi:WxcM-like domain-containing protein [Nocardioides pocheonensis]|uniref:WxcM-like domain-containing protein n=1 Tax=Nocardioides pocheonensis TaxID=661485 RepID=UPI0016146D7E|nr:WxcM-like domain-containing protein [Nocardioides pocheonensis]
MTERPPVFTDERGTLLPIELDDVPFAVRRVFVVHGAEDAPPRGGHVVPCDELVVLVCGSATFRVGCGEDERTVLLGDQGQQVLLRPGEHVTYELDGPGSAILVLASEPFRPKDER